MTCTLYKKKYIGETERRLGDCFCEHLRDVERNDKDASKPVAQHFNLPNHSSQHMMICGLSLYQGNMESSKNLEQTFIFHIGTLLPHGINERFSKGALGFSVLRFIVTFEISFSVFALKIASFSVLVSTAVFGLFPF